MKFEVELAEKADRDLRNIFFYIAVDLSAPENAERQSIVYGTLFYLLMNCRNDTAVMKMNRGTAEVCAFFR